MNTKTKFIIDVVQWVLIIALACACINIMGNAKKEVERLRVEQDENFYKLEYYGQNLVQLKKENEDLYRTVDSLNNVESAIEVRYVYKYSTDTVYVTQLIHDNSDSTYAYKFDNDTIRFNMTAKAKDLEWMKGDFEVNDKFQVITSNEYGKYQTWINHSSNVEIQDVDAWHKKTKWYEHFHYGPAVGVGYGLVNQKFDVWVGGAITYQF